MVNEYNSESLNPETRVKAASLSPAERQRMVDTLLYPHPTFKEGVEFVKKFHLPVVEGYHASGRLGGLLGVSRVGKSQICKYFGSFFPPRIENDAEVYPIVYLPVTADLKPKGLANQLSRLTGARRLASGNIPTLLTHAVERLIDTRCELLIMDDAHFMFEDRRKDDIALFKSFLKEACDAKRFNVLLVGEESLRTTIKIVPHLYGRGSFPNIHLKPLNSSESEFEKFQLLLDGIDNRLPFAEKSKLAGQRIATDFQIFSGGLIGRVMNLVQSAAYRAINDHAPRIMQHHLQAAAKEMVGLQDDYNYFGVIG